MRGDREGRAACDRAALSTVRRKAVADEPAGIEAGRRHVFGAAPAP
jgi:hypothetical protein